MTVEELYEELACLIEDGHGGLEVRMQTPAHDYWKNQLAVSIETAEPAKAVWSDYHETDKVLDEDDERGDSSGRKEVKDIILLS